MKIFVCYKPHAVVVARDSNHAQVLLYERFRRRGVRRRTFGLTEVDTSKSGVLVPPPPIRLTPMNREAVDALARTSRTV